MACLELGTSYTLALCYKRLNEQMNRNWQEINRCVDGFKQAS